MTQSARGHFHWFCYPAPEHERRREQDIHKVRDAGAFAEMATLLTTLGYMYGELIFNLPSSEQAWEKLPKMSGEDLVVLSTRPPLDDPADEEQRVRTISTSGSGFEEKIHEEILRPLLPYCSRKNVTLSSSFAAALDELRWQRWDVNGPKLDSGEPREGLGNIDFYENKGARAKKFNDTSADVRETYSYLICSEQKPDFPRVLAAWGMGGRETLLWCRSLRTRFPGLLARALDSPQRTLIMGEFSVSRTKDRPVTLSGFAPEVIRTVVIEEPSGVRPAKSAGSMPVRT